MTETTTTRKQLDLMTNRELLEELVAGQRQFADALTALSTNPMIRSMIPGGLIK